MCRRLLLPSRGASWWPKSPFLFLLGRSDWFVVAWFITHNAFFYLFFSLSLEIWVGHTNFYSCHMIYDYCHLGFYHFDFKFFSLLFYKKNYFSQFYPSIPILDMLLFSNWSSFIWLIFFSFVELIFLFNWTL